MIASWLLITADSLPGRSSLFGVLSNSIGFADWNGAPDPLRQKGGEPTGVYEDFMTGFVLDEKTVFGRPAGIAVTKNGAAH